MLEAAPTPRPHAHLQFAYFFLLLLFLLVLFLLVEEAEEVGVLVINVGQFIRHLTLQQQVP